MRSTAGKRDNGQIIAAKSRNQPVAKSSSLQGLRRAPGAATMAMRRKKIACLGSCCKAFDGAYGQSRKCRKRLLRAGTEHTLGPRLGSGRGSAALAIEVGRVGGFLNRGPSRLGSFPPSLSVAQVNLQRFTLTGSTDETANVACIG